MNNNIFLCHKNRIEQKMSFGINGPSPKFGIQEAQSMFNNGGGGNLGYFQRGKKKKDKKDEKNEIDIFMSSQDENDILVPDEENIKENFLDKASEFIKKFKKPRRS